MSSTDDTTLPLTPGTAPDTGGAAGTTDITVYWRPGCGFCGRLLRQLEQDEIPHQRVNIWEDDNGAAVVRSIARGNETVPTVTIGNFPDGGHGLVNPSVAQILAAVGPG